MSFMKSLPITSDMVSLWIPSGTGRAIDIIRGNDGQCSGTHPNVPVIRRDSAIGSLVYDGSSGTFAVGEEINGGTSSARGEIVSDSGSVLVLKDCTGLFNNNEEITGAISEATANVNHADGSVGTDGHVKNGAFVDDNDPPADWTAITATLTGGGSGQVGNIMTVASSGANVGRAYQDVTTVVGMVYKFTGYFEKGSSAHGKFFIGTTGDEDAIWDSGNLTDASFAVHTHTFTATATTTRLTCRTNDATDTENSLFDEISLYEIDRKQLIDPSLGWHFDGSNDYIALSSDVVLSATASSFSLWFNLAACDGVILGQSTSSTPYVYFLSTTAIRIQGDSVGIKEFTVPTISLGTWYHLVIIRNAGVVRVYLNTVESTSGGQAIAADLTIDQMGKYGGSWYKGYLALPLITKSAWSAAQVNNFYLATKGLFSPRG